MDYQFDFHWVWAYREAFLNGLKVTLELNLYVVILSTVLGLFLALGRLSRLKLVRVLARIYIDVFRALPLLVLIIWLYFAFPLLTSRRVIFDSFTAACIALTLNLSAFIAEIIRAGILAVPDQHIDAARSLGLTRAQTLRHVTLPIAIRQMIPPLTGQYINSIKLSVLASVIAVPELLHTVQTITTEVFRPIEMYSTLAFIFLAILLPGTWLLYKLERPGIEKNGLNSESDERYATQPVSVRECRLGSGPMKCGGADDQEALVIHEVHQSYNGLPVLQNVSLTAKAGQIVSIIGPNGSGKTTLLRATCGFLPLVGGEIRLGDHLLARGDSKANPKQSNAHVLGTKIGLVSQQVEPWPHLSVLQNVMLPLMKVRGMQKEEARLIAIEWLKALGLQGQLKHHAKELSGGMKQRVVLARTLAMNPRVLLFDEVTSALDPEWSAWVRDLMRELASQGTIVLNVSHKINLVREVSDWVVFLNHGALVEQGAPQEVLGNPKSEQLRLFLACS